MIDKLHVDHSPGEAPDETPARVEATAPETGTQQRQIRRRYAGLAALVGALVLLLAFILPALAVHDEGFQLEGNIDAQDLNTGAASPLPSLLVAPFDGPVDWFDSGTGSGNPSTGNGAPNGVFKIDGTPGYNALANSPLPTTPSGKFVAAGFVRDFGNTAAGSFVTSDPTTYTQGSKDINDVNTWYCVGVNNVTSKGDITNVYAAMEVVQGQRYVYFAMEKDTVNGDNNVGFWFLQDP
ncbi:MAG: hypothetical protein M0Z51_00535, partial [Propionibacterium sp.]|nr:hypothetical protein [Propionibacterium sp.]